MAPTDAEDTALVRHNGAAKLWDAKRVVQIDLVTDVFLNIKEVDRFAAPLEVVNKLVRRVALLQDERVVQQLAKFVDDIHILVVRNAAGEFA